MTLRTDTFDLGGLRLTSGEGRRLDLHVAIDRFELGGEHYRVTADLVPVRLDISRTTGDGYALRLRFAAVLSGPCMRCLEPAGPTFEVDAREISQARAEAEELDSTYVRNGVLDLASWARDSLALTLPAAVLCQAECGGLCPVCGENLNLAGPDHHHDAPPDPRWSKLGELRFD